MSYKAQQVLRTKVPLKSENGAKVAPNTRVVVMRMVEDNRVRARIADPLHPTLAKSRLVAGVNAFKTTHRGRPKGEK